MERVVVLLVYAIVAFILLYLLVRIVEALAT